MTERSSRIMRSMVICTLMPRRIMAIIGSDALRFTSGAMKVEALSNGCGGVWEVVLEHRLFLNFYGPRMPRVYV
jgi:hypothetical protein